MFNEPVSGEKFFGREEVLELLNKRAMALKEGYRQNVALTGQSLVGKSSIILHFLYTIREEGFIPIYVEVIKEPFNSFANKFIATLLYNSLSRMGEEVGIDIGRLLENAQRLLPKASLAIKQINSQIDRGDFDEAYSNLLGLTSVLKDEIGIPCIVILDEFDNLEYLGVKNPFLSFGKVIMVQKDTMYIVSSSRNSAIKKIISEKLSLLFGNFEILKISNFGLKTSSDFIDLKLSGFEIENSMKAFLMTFTDGNPFYLGEVIKSARSIAMEQMTSFVDKDIISKAILELIFNSGGAIHQYLFNFVLDLLDTKYREFYISILVAIASAHNRQLEISRALKIKHRELSNGLARLVELGLVSKNGVFYKIDDAMLGFWLKFVYQRRKQILVDGTFDKMRLFSEDIRSYISNTSLEFDKDAAVRIAELFDLFSNELVQIDSKQIRLPHFTRVEVKAFQDSKSFVSASFRGNFWIAQPYKYTVGENDIIDYIRNIKTLKCKISNKVILPLKGIDENAKLLAKELKISIWDSSTVNMVLGFYGKSKMFIL